MFAKSSKEAWLLMMVSRNQRFNKGLSIVLQWLGCCCFLASAVVDAQETVPPVTQPNLVLQFDNDLVFGTDRQYTGGFKVYWTEPTLAAVEVLFNAFEVQLLKPLLNRPIWNSVDQMGFSTEIYTLKGIASGQEVSIANAAWSEFYARRFYQQSNAQVILDVNLGWIGPENRGEDLQNGVHSLVGNSNVEGWERQPPNRLTAELGLEYREIFYSDAQERLNLFGAFYGELGLPRTSLALGLGGYYAVNASPVFAFSGFNHLRHKNADWGWFGYVNAQIQHHIYDELLDGKFFAGDAYRVKENSLFFASVEYGLGLQIQQVSVILHGTSMGQVYEGQTERIFRYASLLVSFPL